MSQTVDVQATARRWSTAYDRGAHDYTDGGCRVLAEHAFRDVPALLAEIARLGAIRDEAFALLKTAYPGDFEQTNGWRIRVEKLGAWPVKDTA